MTESSEDKKGYPTKRAGYEACPNCGQELSPWQQVLLRIDRALVCKNCWYRIILDITEEEIPQPPRNRG